MPGTLRVRQLSPAIHDIVTSTTSGLIDQDKAIHGHLFDGTFSAGQRYVRLMLGR